jgi:hypothetical protein
MNVRHSSRRLVGGHYGVTKVRYPVFFLRERVCRNLFQIMFVHQVLQGLRCLLLIERVIVDGLPHHAQVLFELYFPSPPCRAPVDESRYQSDQEYELNSTFMRGPSGVFFPFIPQFNTALGKFP